MHRDEDIRNQYALQGNAPWLIKWRFLLIMEMGFLFLKTVRNHWISKYP